MAARCPVEPFNVGTVTMPVDEPFAVDIDAALIETLALAMQDAQEVITTSSDAAWPKCLSRSLAQSACAS